MWFRTSPQRSRFSRSTRPIPGSAWSVGTTTPAPWLNRRHLLNSVGLSAIVLCATPVSWFIWELFGKSGTDLPPIVDPPPPARLPQTQIVLADLTDEAVPDIAAIQREIDVIAKSAATGDHLIVLTLAATGPDADPTRITQFDLACPDDGKNASSLYENSQMLARIHEETWVIPLASLAKDKILPLAGKDARQTPLMATLREIGRSGWLDAPGGASVLIFSDMLENRPDDGHRPGFSMYAPNFPAFSQLHAAGEADAQVDNLFARTDIVIALLRPQKSRKAQNNPRQAKFWKDFFACAKAKDLQTHPV